MGTALTLATLHGTEMFPMSDAKAAMKRETNVNKMADFTKQIEAIRVADSRNHDRRNYWGELAIWSNRRLGEMLVTAQENGTLATKATGRPKKQVAHDGPLTLGDIGIERHHAQRSQKLAAIPDKIIAKYIEHVGAPEQRADGVEVNVIALFVIVTTYLFPKR